MNWTLSAIIALLLVLSVVIAERIREKRRQDLKVYGL